MQKKVLKKFKSLVSNIFYDPHFIFNVLKHNSDNQSSSKASGLTIDCTLYCVRSTLIEEWSWSSVLETGLPGILQNSRERPSHLDLLYEIGLISDGWLGSIVYLLRPWENEPMHLSVEGLRQCYRAKQWFPNFSAKSSDFPRCVIHKKRVKKVKEFLLLWVTTSNRKLIFKKK